MRRPDKVLQGEQGVPGIGQHSETLQAGLDRGSMGIEQGDDSRFPLLVRDFSRAKQLRQAVHGLSLEGSGCRHAGEHGLPRLRNLKREVLPQGDFFDFQAFQLRIGPGPLALSAGENGQRP